MGFTLNGNLAIIGERKKFQDSISIIRLADWTLDSHFETETQDFKSIQLNKLGAVIALNDPLPKPQIVIYSITGKKLAAIPNGFWSPTSQFLAVSNALDFDIYNHITWRKIASCSPFNPAQVVYEERNNQFVLSQEGFKSYIESDDLPQMSKVKFSPQNTFAAAVQGRTVQVYSVKTLRLAGVMLLKNAVKTVLWSPTEDRLIATCNNSNIYLWSMAGCMVVRIPHSQFVARSFVWAPSGDSAVLFGKEKCAITFFANKENVAQSQGHKHQRHEEIDSKLKNLNIINA